MTSKPNRESNADRLKADPAGEAKRRAWREDGQVRFTVPPVLTVYWTEADWIMWVDWDRPSNAAILAKYQHDPLCSKGQIAGDQTMPCDCRLSREGDA